MNDRIVSMPAKLALALITVRAALTKSWHVRLKF